MRLESMWVHGLRRFGGEDPHRLRVDGKLVCIIGANEVGKSTLLDALVMSQHERMDPETDEVLPVDTLLRTRGEAIPPDRELVKVRYRLDGDDLGVLAAEASPSQLKEVRWLIRTLHADGHIVTTLDPPPQRDKTPRRALANALNEAAGSAHWPPSDELVDTPADSSALSAAIDILSSNRHYLGQQTTNALVSLADWIDSSEERLATWLAASKSHRGISNLIRETLEAEAVAHPLDQAKRALVPRIPVFIQFDKNERGIGDEYDLADPDLPEALRNLADLAGLDLQNLHDKIISGETGTVEDLRDAANAELARRFGSWSQKPSVKVSFGLSGTRLFVHVKSGSGPSMRLGERSEGLRQFVALVALTAQHQYTVSPILLIDEVEMHLHYDAQADLIGVLAEQETAAQVIYTTHSAACLPEDLGSAVRVVEGIDDLTASRIRSQFWSENVGLGTLLMAIGAASLALVLLRPAALVEGGADLVLLPTLMREAIGEETIGFQVVPGGAEAARERVVGLDLHGTATIWIYDGDNGGKAKRDLLIAQGVDRARILLLTAGATPLELEDFVHPVAYVEAVNRYGVDVGMDSARFSQDDLPDETTARHDAVTGWFHRHGLRPPSKVAVANKILDLRGEYPLLDRKRKRTLVRLHASARAIFDTDQNRRREQNPQP